jgi:hypothetical protein
MWLVNLSLVSSLDVPRFAKLRDNIAYRLTLLLRVII